jgi:hypothetical protein
MEVRAEIDNELTEKSIAFMKEENAKGKPFFLYLPFSMATPQIFPPNSSQESPALVSTATN